MPNYTLNISISKDDLRMLFDAGERVTLMKRCSDGSQVAWIVFDPFEKNTVQWTSNYALYATSIEKQSGAKITKLSDIQASPTIYYPFEKGSFSAPISVGEIDLSAAKLGPCDYGIVNYYDKVDTLGFGLAQEALVNGTALDYSPINLVNVPQKHSTVFTPYESIIVFTHAKIEAATVVSEIQSKSLQVDFKKNNEATVKYIKDAGKFVLQ